jgi:hypothetical protein
MDAKGVPKVHPPIPDLPVPKSSCFLDLESSEEVSRKWPISGQFARRIVHNRIASADQEARCDDLPRRTIRSSEYQGATS